MPSAPPHALDLCCMGLGESEAPGESKASWWHREGSHEIDSSPSCGVCDIYVTAPLLLQMNHSELELGEPISLSELHACQLTAPPLLLPASSSQSVNSLYLKPYFPAFFTDISPQHIQQETWHFVFIFSSFLHIVILWATYFLSPELSWIQLKIGESLCLNNNPLRENQRTW